MCNRPAHGALRRTPSRRVALALVAAGLAACGGGAADGTSGDAAGAAFNRSTWTNAQAKKMVARTVQAIFVADEVATMAHVTSFLARTTGGVPLANFSAGCASGSGSGTFTDADASGSFSAGDFATYTLAGCTVRTGSRWSFSGNPVATLTGGTDIAGFLAGRAGALAERWDANGTQFAPGHTIHGSWSTRVESGAGGQLVASSTSLDGLVLMLGPVAASFSGVQLAAGNGSALTVLSGRVTTHVEGLGKVAVEVSLLTPSGLPLADDPFRYAPTGGTVRLRAANWWLDVEYGPAGAVTLKLDEGRDGSTELALATTVAELDALLSSP